MLFFLLFPYFKKADVKSLSLLNKQFLQLTNKNIERLIIQFGKETDVTDVETYVYQVKYLKGLLNKISTVSTDISSIRKISSLSRELKAQNESFEEMKETIIKDFELKPNEKGGYGWKK